MNSPVFVLNQWLCDYIRKLTAEKACFQLETSNQIMDGEQNLCINPLREENVSFDPFGIQNTKPFLVAFV